jgi:serine/threonine protein kinase
MLSALEWSDFRMSKTNDIKQLIEAGGKYTVLSEFTEGANGYAFKGHHKHLQCDMFLKVIDADAEADKTFAEPRAVMDALANGSCENLVRLHDTEHLTSDYILMSMEYVEGGSLNKLIMDRSLGQMDAVQITLGVLAGVGHLHKARFLHRDVKPGNLLMKFSNTGIVPKVGDFGSVRRLEAQENQVAASRHSALYRPSEAWGDQGWFTFSSDLYQVAVCLYEMINGPLPYSFEPYLDAQAKKLMKEKGVTSFTQLDSFDKSQVADGCLERRIKTNKLLEMTPPQPYFSKRLGTIIRKATTVDVTERFQDAYEFHNALQGFSAPNWMIGGEVFTAASWKAWDWKVNPSTSASTIYWLVSRARQGTGKYRGYGGQYPSAKVACRSVEQFN